MNMFPAPPSGYLGAEPPATPSRGQYLPGVSVPPESTPSYLLAPNLFMGGSVSANKAMLRAFEPAVLASPRTWGLPNRCASRPPFMERILEKRQGVGLSAVADCALFGPPRHGVPDILALSTLFANSWGGGEGTPKDPLPRLLRRMN